MRRLPNLPLLLAPFLLLSPVLFAGQALYWGTPALQFHPWRAYAWETMRAGHLPLWNPLVGMGAPLIANYQSAFFYPPNWLYFVLGAIGGEPAMAWGMGLIVALHLAFAGLGMARLTRALGLGTLAQTIAGLAYSLSGYLIARAGFLSINAASAWLPWVLWGVYRLVTAAQKESPRPPASFRSICHPHIFVLAFFIGMQLLTGHAQTTWYTLLLAGLWAGFWSWRNAYSLMSRGDVPRGVRLEKVRVLAAAWGRLAVAGVLGGLLAAIQLLPTAELLAQSQRAAGADFDFVMTYSFWPWRLLTLLAPNFFGSPVSGDYWGYASYWEDAIYIGLLPLLLVVRAFFHRKTAPMRPYRALQTFLLTLLGVTFIFAFGKNTPVYPFLYRHIPTFDMFQAPARWMLWGVFALALLAGLGAETWARPPGPKARSRTMMGIMIALAFALAALGASFVLTGRVETFIRPTALAGIFGVGVGLLTLTAPRAQQMSKISRWHWAAAVFVAVDLLIAGWGLNPGLPLDFYRQPAPNGDEVRAMLGEGRLYLPADDIYTLTFDQYFRFSSYQGDYAALKATFLPNLNIQEDVAMVNNFDPLIPGRYARWMEALPEADAVTQAQMLAVMSVNGVAQAAPTEPLGVRFMPVEGKPRFRWAPCAWPASSRENAWHLQFEAPPALARDVVIIEDYETNAEYVCGEHDDATVRKTAEHPNHIQLHVQAASSGWLVIADAWYPGWQARVDGELAPIYPADYVFRAVPVPSGEHVVEITYRPVSFYAGAALSGLACLLVAGGYWWGNRD